MAPIAPIPSSRPMFGGAAPSNSTTAPAQQPLQQSTPGTAQNTPHTYLNLWTYQPDQCAIRSVWGMGR